MTVKRAHMVPKGYLRAWADNKDRVDVLDLQKGIGNTAKISNATIVGYAYRNNLLQRDLEHDYSVIEDAGIRAIRHLRQDESITESDRDAVIRFLDMHLDRGRYADQAGIDVPAVIVKADGLSENVKLSSEDVTLSLADRLLLSQGLPDVLRLSSLGIQDWPWHVREARSLATGDGAVLLWETTAGAGVSTVTFPLSPAELLVIGEELPAGIGFNTRLAENSRRWIVGAPGTLNLPHAEVIASLRASGAQPST